MAVPFTLEVKALSKSFGATQALKDVSLTVQSGLVHALIGENGAGKSTLVKILKGDLAPDGGELLWNGASFRPWASGKDRSRVAMIYQELNLAPHLKGVQNLFLGRERSRGAGFLLEREMKAEAERVLSLLEHGDIPLDVPVGRLSPAYRQILEIAKALLADANIVIMDEPTSSLSQRDTEVLFRVVRRLSESGVGVVYISHFLEEIKEVAHSFTVLRDGTVSGRGEVGNSSVESLVEMMVGGFEGLALPPPPPCTGKNLLTVRVALALSLRENVSLIPSGEYVKGGGWILRGREGERVQGFLKRLSVLFRSLEQPAGELSGGNQQKVAFARLLNAEASIVVLDEPTRGVDIKAKGQIYKIIRELASQGRGVLVAGSYFSELLPLCHRIVVMYRGRIVAEREASAWNERDLLLTATVGRESLSEKKR
ncbi:MAG: Ribose import ATP-binding protein RbsA [Candidatus Aminicenantes bacterium ADurb.Bin508]|nr:MAG: Ribose import ATP-binding protein RbsA [Candidatus Aminicenantes bacterium ADurb.Bin508]